ncbi:MAG TPA: PQQ-binding-like beta-propeller repeat protein [Phycisphaerae bacterium]|nr:PQQ-binding-like beta-propeller repeat protein [Phycisphaerae bacterium]
MHVRHCSRVFKWMLVAAALTPAAVLASAVAADGTVQDFCFLHISDMHVSPVPLGTGKEDAARLSAAGIAWVCDEAAKPQVLGPLNMRTPPPSFLVATGDITEYGVINETWGVVEDLFKPLSIPWYITPGNHDNTWTAIQRIMRQRHCGDHYSFDRFGCHFAFINTATPQEPVPTIEQRTLTWLADDLKKVSKTTPVFVLCHHPLSSTEFAKPYEQLRLIELLGSRNVVLLLMGHGHGARHERWGTIDSVMGGSTYGPNTGYGIISVMNGVLRSTYRFHDSSKPMALLIEKPIAPADKAQLEFQLPPRKGDNRPMIRTAGVPVRVRISGGQPQSVTACINGDDQGGVALKGDNQAGTFSGSLPAGFLPPGVHFVRVMADMGPYQLDRACEFTYKGKSTGPVGRVAQLAAGVKATPLAADQEAVVCTTTGEVVRVSFKEPVPTITRLLDVGSEILHPPAQAGDVLYIGAAEKGVYAISAKGKPVWQWKPPAPGNVVYGTPAVDQARVYVGDLEGFVHAIDRKSGQSLWSKRHATFSIEQSLLLRDGRLYFGAWDGLVYCIDAAEGNLIWKKPGPAGNRSEAASKSRYYAPADCSPIIVGDRLFVCDRDYRLGSYSLTGEYHAEISEGIAAIGLTADKKGFYARGLAKGVSRYDGLGKRIWKNDEVLMGRFPVPPVEADGRVYACSNRGLLVALDADDGKLLWQYQATPQLHVMAGVALDKNGRAYVAGMDGSVTQVSVENK